MTKNKLIKRSEIKEELRPISQSNVDYVTRSGKVYCDYGNDMFYPKTNSINNHNGYLYTSIKCSDSKQRRCRTHRLVAEAFLPNPNNYPIVMHLDDNKANPNANNLKWGTTSENTQSAFDKGLAYNDAGFEDDQSIPVAVFDLDKRLINTFGSISIAHSVLGVSKSTISRQCKHTINNYPRCGYYFRYLDEYEMFGFVL